MKGADEKKLKDITEQDIAESYQGIIDINKASHALFIVGLMISTSKKYKNIYLKDRIYVLKNLIAYKYHSFINERCADVILDETFFKTRKFLKEFKATLEEFEYLLKNNVYTPYEVADIYLCYFTFLTIHNRIIANLNNELKRASIETMNFSVDLPIEKNIDENLDDFQTILRLVRELKEEKEDKN